MEQTGLWKTRTSPESRLKWAPLNTVVPIKDTGTIYPFVMIFMFTPFVQVHRKTRNLWRQRQLVDVTKMQLGFFAHQDSLLLYCFFGGGYDWCWPEQRQKETEYWNFSVLIQPSFFFLNNSDTSTTFFEKKKNIGFNTLNRKSLSSGIRKLLIRYKLHVCVCSGYKL